MFSDLILRNSRRSRKENGLFFSALVISIVAFYIILSISSQDVIRFLKDMESDAVNKLLLMIPVFYMITLVILFFLIYFACRYQLQRRRHEFGVYLMMGMSRKKLFSMLLAEDLIGSALVLMIGLPIAILLSELISLITARLVGIGIIGHRFTLSASAVFFTIAGVLTIKFLAFLLLSGKICRQEIGSLLSGASLSLPKRRSPTVYGFCFLCGISMTASAYLLAIRGIAWQKTWMMLFTLLLGTVGTILLFYGMRSFISLLIRAEKADRKLRLFNFRQVQEHVILQSTSLAVSSLLILAALCCSGAGIGIARIQEPFSTRLLDYTFELNRNMLPDESFGPAQIFPEVRKLLKENDLETQFSQLFQIREGHIRTGAHNGEYFIIDSITDALKKLPQTPARDTLLNNLSYLDVPRIICLSDYNQLLKLAGRPVLELSSDEAALYRDADFTDAAMNSLLNRILSSRPSVGWNDHSVFLTGEVQSLPLVTDRSITLDFALIIPDEQFFSYTQNHYNVYVNGILNEKSIRQGSLMNVYASINQKLDAVSSGNLKLTYESYLQNIGRQLFYLTAASYITSYLAIILLVVSNTIMGVQFLMNQQQTGRRYLTLIRLGATYQTLCHSARKQINWFMGLPVTVAAVGSLFGIKALFSGILSPEAQNAQGELLKISAVVILLLCIVEWIYMTAIKRSSDRYLLTLMQPEREE